MRVQFEAKVEITPEMVEAFRRGMNGSVPESKWLATYRVPESRLRAGLQEALAMAVARLGGDDS